MISCNKCFSLVCKEHSFIPEPNFNPVELSYCIYFDLALCINCNDGKYKGYTEEVHKMKCIIKKERRTRDRERRFDQYLIGKILTILKNIEKYVNAGNFYTCGPDYYHIVDRPIQNIVCLKLTEEEWVIIKDWSDQMKETYGWRSLRLDNALINRPL